MSADGIAEKITQKLTWEDLDQSAIRQLIKLAKQEDLEGWGLAIPPAQFGDVTSQAIQSGNEPASAHLIAREKLVVCGLHLVQLVMDTYGNGATFKPLVQDGAICASGRCLGTLAGPARLLLESERILLNFLQRLSGVASSTRSYVDAMGDTPTRLLDTRKTTPGYRVLEKYAVACGGGYNHRIGLFDRVILKDNHLAADKASHGQALAELVLSVRNKWPEMVIELEVDAINQIPPALGSGADVFLLDNFTRDELIEAIQLIGGAAATEASGGITMESLAELSLIGLDFISTGATIHKSTWKDIALDWEI